MITLFILSAFIPLFAGGATEDRLLAVVNKHLITESDLRIAKIFSLEFPLPEVKDRDPHLQFAIDEILLEEDAEKFAVPSPSAKEVEAQISESSPHLPQNLSLDQALEGEGLSGQDLRDLVIRFLKVKSFINQRINFFIFVNDQEIDDTLAENRSIGEGTPPEQARKKAEELIADKKRKVKLEEYLVKRRAKAAIRILEPASP